MIVKNDRMGWSSKLLTPSFQVRKKNIFQIQVKGGINLQLGANDCLSKTVTQQGIESF